MFFTHPSFTLSLLSEQWLGHPGSFVGQVEGSLEKHVCNTDDFLDKEILTGRVEQVHALRIIIPRSRIIYPLLRIDTLPGYE